jgi:hypothetical protein
MRSTVWRKYVGKHSKVSFPSIIIANLTWFSDEIVEELRSLFTKIVYMCCTFDTSGDAFLRSGRCFLHTHTLSLTGAIKLAKELGPGHTIVTILCDYGTRYQGKIYNVDFLKSKGLPYPEWLDTAQKTSQIPTVFVDPEAV